MSPTHGTSSTLYVSILETLWICTLHFMMNKVLFSIICLHYVFSPLQLLSSKLLHNELHHEIAITAPPHFSISPTCDHHKHSAVFLHISEMFRQPLSSTRSALISMEKTQSLISPYTYYRIRALCYGWSAVVPWSCLFLLHVHGLHAWRYGLWAS